MHSRLEYLVLSLVLWICGVTANKCFTATTFLAPQNCPPKPPGCFELECLQIDTVTHPCPNKKCKITPTVTKTATCTGCRTGCDITTTTVTASSCSSCYTASITQPPSPYCPPLPSGCVELLCIIESTVTAPCRDRACRTTPTVTTTEPCRTTCRAGCATTYTTVTATCTPTPK